MRYLVTGGAGFIGSACVAEILNRGHEAVVIDCFETTLYDTAIKKQNLAWLKTLGEYDFHEIDIRDVEALNNAVADDIDAVIHLAAVAGVRPSIVQPSLYYDINVTGTSNVLQACRAKGITKFALASSSSVYGGNEKTPFAESDPVEEPVSPYAASKRALELLARTDQLLHGGDISCLRFFTVYGPRQRPEMAIHKFMRRMVNGEVIPMFGDGTSGRDYTYIDDIVAGVLATVDRLNGFQIYNLGGDEVVYLADLIATIGEVTGHEPNIEKLPMQQGDVFITNADVSKSRRELDYDPKTSIRDGVEKMWAWYQTAFPE